MSVSKSETNPPKTQSTMQKILDNIWPIERHELPKFLSITLLLFCILFIQNLIRATKDSVVNTMIGTETIAFLKSYGVLPAAFLITILYVKLVSSMKPEKIFYIMMSSFLVFFAFFGFVIFPYHEYFHLSPEDTSNLVQQMPHLKWFILLFSKWGFSLFYIIAELWPNAVFALLFWQFVNNVTTVEESKRFYILFGLLGQTGLVISGTFLKNLSFISSNLIDEYNLALSINTVSVELTMLIVSILGVIGLCTFWMLNNKILKGKTSEVQFKVKKKSMSLSESLKMVLASRYIRLIATILICYGIAINLVESPWKKQATMVYPEVHQYLAFVGGYLHYTGIFTLIFVLLGSNIVRKLGWFAAAIITPIMVFTTGGLFFVTSNFTTISNELLGGLMMMDPIMLAINIGAINNVLSKSSKYTLFDSTKEMSYVPLNDELKTKGKAAADVIGTKLGKSASALLQSLIFVIFPSATYQSISIYLMGVFTFICIVWIWAVIELSKEYKAAIKEV
ncbi:MAG: NTP/NDP exchange transporter [Rickettsiaceae bacterium]|nr:NTP/NDP exchange transporter [Rickettsiaceae bacterium]